MSLTINTNIAATRASKYLASNHQNLQKSLDRLSSGKRITGPADDAGGLAVSMKLQFSIDGLKGVANGISNGISIPGPGRCPAVRWRNGKPDRRAEKHV